MPVNSFTLPSSHVIIFLFTEVACQTINWVIMVPKKQDKAKVLTQKMVIKVVELGDLKLRKHIARNTVGKGGDNDSRCGSWSSAWR